MMHGELGKYASQGFYGVEIRSSRRSKGSVTMKTTPYLRGGLEGHGSGGMFDFGACKEDGPETREVPDVP
jgi:hypothetical protein